MAASAEPPIHTSTGSLGMARCATADVATGQHRRVLVVGRASDVVVADEQRVEPGGARGRGPLDHPPRARTRDDPGVRTAP
jgi:hypothetical protein